MTAETPRSAAPELPTAPASPQVDPEPTPTTNGPETANLGDRAGAAEVTCCGERFPVDQEFAVVVAALLAARIDGQQAIASLVAIHNRILAARVDAALAPVRELAETWAREAEERGHEDQIYTGGAATMLATALDRQEDHR